MAKNGRASAGRVRELSLREKEKLIARDLFNQTAPNGGSLILFAELVHKYLPLKVNVRHNIQASCNFVLGLLKAAYYRICCF